MHASSGLAAALHVLAERPHHRGLRRERLGDGERWMLLRQVEQVAGEHDPRGGGVRPQERNEVAGQGVTSLLREVEIREDDRANRRRARHPLPF